MPEKVSEEVSALVFGFAADKLQSLTLDESVRYAAEEWTRLVELGQSPEEATKVVMQAVAQDTSDEMRTSTERDASAGMMVATDVLRLARKMERRCSSDPFFHRQLVTVRVQRPLLDEVLAFFNLTDTYREETGWHGKGIRVNRNEGKKDPFVRIAWQDPRRLALQELLEERETQNS